MARPGFRFEPLRVRSGLDFASARQHVYRVHEARRRRYHRLGPHAPRLLRVVDLVGVVVRYVGVVVRHVGHVGHAGHVGHVRYIGHIRHIRQQPGRLVRDLAHVEGQRRRVRRVNGAAVLQPGAGMRRRRRLRRVREVRECLCASAKGRMHQRVRDRGPGGRRHHRSVQQADAACRRCRDPGMRVAITIRGGAGRRAGQELVSVCRRARSTQRVRRCHLPVA